MAEMQEMTRLLRRLVWFSVAALALIAGTSGVFFIVERDAREAFFEKREVSRIARTAAALATDRQTGIRGYELTRNQALLAPEIIGREQLPPKLDSLAALTASDPAQANRVAAIAAAVARWENEFARPALSGVTSVQRLDKPLFDEVRAAFKAFLTASDKEWQREAARMENLQPLRVATVLVELLAFLGILLFIIRGRLMGQAKELGRRQELLEQQAVELELQMEEVQATNDSLAQHEESLRKSEERYRYAASLSNDAIYDWDVNSNRFEWNEGLRGLFGYPEEEVGTTLEWIVSLLHPEDTDRVMGTFNSVFEKGGGNQWKAEYRLRRKDGKYANAEGRACIIRAADGTPKRVIGAISDRTQQQSLEGQLRQAQKMEAIGRLAGGIAHDFNNILTVIRMSSEFLLADIPESDERHQDANEIMKAADRASRLTRQLLAFSRHQVLNPRLLSVNEIISGMEGMARRVVPENINLVTELDAELVQVRADAGQMEQVLLNLVINGADAMPNGGQLAIRTANMEVDASFSASRLDVPPGQYACITVSDTGVGMDQETVSRIFEPFFTTKGVGKGTGLGLSTVHGIVTQSGGKVWVYSEPGVGTTFKIFLPKGEGVPTPSKTPVLAEPTAAPTETILLVEDEEQTREAIHRNLVRAGYRMLVARNGVEALEIAKLHSDAIHLVLTDSLMPEMGGAELVKNLKKERPDIAVLMMSGYTEELAPTGPTNDNEFFIEKPFTTADLMLGIRTALKA
jgi:two-component system cell cycle sensor histidine kinase/response regulator CckA